MAAPLPSPDMDAVLAAEPRALAVALGDTPYTAIAVHQLSWGLADAWTVGEYGQGGVVVVQSRRDASEPMAFGDDARALAAIMRERVGWRCVSVPTTAGPEVLHLLNGGRGRLYRDLFHVDVADQRVQLPTTAPHVRRLTSRDVDILTGADQLLAGHGYPAAGDLLAQGVGAGAVVDGRLVSIAHSYAVTTRHVDIGVATLPQWRGRGLALAGAALVVRWARESGRVAVWSAGEANAGSLAIARRLGFRRVGERVYVIPEGRGLD